MKYFITESHFKEYVRLLSEEEEEDYDYLDDDYDDEDFIEVFFEYFRPWVRSTHGEDASRYPMSYLLKKYFFEFCRHYKLSDNRYLDDDEEEYWTTSQLYAAGKSIIIKLKHKLPTSLPSFKFTEKYTKQLDYIIKSLRLPEWLTITFNEPRPFDIEVKLTVNYNLYLKSDGENTVHDYYSEFKKFLTDFMGVEEGNPSHGGLKLTEEINLENNDAFTNPKSIKLLKSKIKSLPNANKIHSIKISVNSNNVTIQLNFLRDYSYDYTLRNEIRDEIYKMLSKEGYNPSIVRVSI